MNSANTQQPLISHGVWGPKGMTKSAITAFLLGTSFGVGICLSLMTVKYRDFGLYAACLSLFHLWEFCYVSLFHPDELSFDSFLLNHSRAYTMAFVAAMVEYWIERLLFPSMKGQIITLLLGTLLVVGGLIIRIVAMYTAGRHFHHYIRDQKEEGHDLVTHGIYKYLRHPSYFGWFWYSVGTQILLANPICTCGYAYVSYLFFSDRIEAEEATLIQFFGDNYKRYRERTMVGIPFIK